MSNLFETVIRQKNPDITNEDVSEIIRFLRKSYSKITKKLVSQPYNEQIKQQVEEECNQVLRDLRLAGYYDRVPRVRIKHEVTNGRVTQLSLEYY